MAESVTPRPSYRALLAVPSLGRVLLRQRVTDPAWMGRAFTVSMNLNFSGYPIGAAIAGQLVGISIEATIIFAVVTNAAGAVLAQLLIPRAQEGSIAGKDMP